MAELTEPAGTEIAPSPSNAPVQPIVLLIDPGKPATQADMIAAAALASVSVNTSGLHTVAVLPVDTAAYLSARAAHPEAVEAVLGDPAVSTARALALRPAPADSLPRVPFDPRDPGTQLPAADAPTVRSPGATRILLNRELGMGTCQAAAQAARALSAWRLLALDRDESMVHWWERDGRPVAVEWTTARGVVRGMDTHRPGPLIRADRQDGDEPGPVTAIAVTA